MTKNKDTNIRVFRDDYLLLKEAADTEGCSIKYMVSLAIEEFVNNHYTSGYEKKD